MPKLTTWIVIALIVPYGAVASQEIPFVGCPADGQAGPLIAPHGSAKVVAVDASIARQLAYYKAKDGLGVFAPKGWYCRSWYGSSGATLIVAPKDFDPPFFPMPRIDTPAVAVSNIFGGTSGRFGVASIAARYFPTKASRFVSAVRDEAAMLNSLDTSMVDRRKYPNDSLGNLNDVTVESITPAMSSGIGTEDDFSATSEATKGVIVLNLPNTEVPSVSIVRIRMSSAMATVEHVIIQLEEACLQDDVEC